MQKVRVLGQIANVGLVGADKRVIERDIHRSIAVLNIKDHCVSARLSPALHNLNSMITSSHQSGKVDRAYFKVFWDRNRFFRNRFIQDSRNRELLSGLQKCPMYFRVAAAN